jgi:signal transduction histidine kinase
VQDLSVTIQTLQQTQRELVEAEKLASLGALVAGVSHELNTPIGNALVAASALQDHMAEMETYIAEGQLKKSTLATFMRNGATTASLVHQACERASTLVSSFKQVAVDQTSEQRRTFNLRTLVDDVANMLHPTMRNEPWQIDIDIPNDIACDSYPGPISQVLTNLIQNAAIHAFHQYDGPVKGQLHISAYCSNGLVEMQVQDNGCGMPVEVLLHIFDPFFTTRLGKGGSGLGLSVSRNIAVAVLGGSLTATSTPGMGSCFLFNFPASTKGL